MKTTVAPMARREPGACGCGGRGRRALGPPRGRQTPSWDSGAQKLFLGPKKDPLYEKLNDLNSFRRTI
jgi:hypothetical protein